MRRGVPTGSPVCEHGYTVTRGLHPDGKACLTGGITEEEIQGLVTVLKLSPEVRREALTVNTYRLATELLSSGYRFVDPAEKHVIELGAESYTIKHPLACRAGDLFACEVTAAAARTGWAAAPARVGRFECVVQAGHLVLLGASA